MTGHRIGRSLRPLRHVILYIVLGQHFSQYTLQDCSLDRLRYEFRKSLIPEHLPRPADRVRGQGDHRFFLISPVVDLLELFQRLHAVKARHHVIQKDDVIRDGRAALHSFFPAETGIHLHPITAQDPFCHHQVHLLIVDGQGPDSRAGEWSAACGLGFAKFVCTYLAIQQIYDRQG